MRLNVGIDGPVSAGKSSVADAVAARLGIKSGSLERERLFDDSLPVSLKRKLSKLREPVLESGRVVFEDLIYLAIQLLEGDAEARSHFQSMWTEILVDEYQDINPSQYRMVKALLGDRKSLFVVGDDDQAIYGFRGADIGNINRFCDDFKESTLIRLEWNYRSTSNILHLANRIFENKPLRLRKVLRAGNSNGSGGTASQKLSFAAGTVAVNLEGRGDLKAIAKSESPYIVTWATKPADTVSFVLDDATAAHGFKVRVRDSGLELVPPYGFMLIVR